MFVKQFVDEGLGNSSYLIGSEATGVAAVIDPQRDPRGTGYQTIQSVIAVGSGGFSGRGLGNGSHGGTVEGLVGFVGVGEDFHR